MSDLVHELGGGGGVGGAALVRDTAEITTASLAHLAESACSIGIGKSAMVLSVETDCAARVRVYFSDAKRDADASRDVLDAPPQNSGLLFEVLTTGAETVPFAPAVNAWNFEDPDSPDLFALVQNRSGSTSAVEVTVTKITLEA